MISLTGDTNVTPAVQKGMAVLGAFLTRAARESAPTDDTPHVLTQEEKLSILGETAGDALGMLGN